MLYCAAPRNDLARTSAPCPQITRARRPHISSEIGSLLNKVSGSASDSAGIPSPDVVCDVFSPSPTSVIAISVLVDDLSSSRDAEQPALFVVSEVSGVAGAGRTRESPVGIPDIVLSYVVGGIDDGCEPPRPVIRLSSVVGGDVNVYED